MDDVEKQSFKKALEIIEEYQKQIKASKAQSTQEKTKQERKMTEPKNLWWKYADEIGESVKRYWKEAKHQRDIVKKLFFSDNKKTTKTTD